LVWHQEWGSSGEAVDMAAIRMLQNLICSKTVAIPNCIMDQSAMQNLGWVSCSLFMNYAMISVKKKGGWSSVTADF
jgi:hypothetical protein